MFNSQRISGYTNLITNKNEELAEKRIEICKNCELHENHPILGIICSSKKSKSGVYGCGCVMAAKARNKESGCILNKW